MTLTSKLEFSDFSLGVVEWGHSTGGLQLLRVYLTRIYCAKGHREKPRVLYIDQTEPFPQPNPPQILFKRHDISPCLPPYKPE